MIEIIAELTDNDSIVTICNSVECSFNELKMERNSGAEIYTFPAGRLCGSFFMRKGDFVLKMYGKFFVTRKIKDIEVKND